MDTHSRLGWLLCFTAALAPLLPKYEVISMYHRLIDRPMLFSVTVVSIIMIAPLCGIALGGYIAHAPFVGGNVGCAIGCLLVGKIMFANPKPSADSSPPSTTQPEE